MGVGVIGRVSELDAIERFLDSAAQGPAALVFEGEPGIGKTTLVLAGVEAARRRGCRVLSCAGSSSEARLSHAALADLLRGVEDDSFEDLPPPQRDALDAALLRSDPGAGPIDPRAVAMATLSVLERLAAQGPVVVAIDDLQWLDRPTAHAIAFCARRLAGPVGLIASRRTGPGEDAAKPAIVVRAPDRVEVRQVTALPAAELGEVLRGRASKPLGRRDLDRVYEASAGNPFYAVELARALPDDVAPAALPLPESLEEVVSARTAGLGPELEEALLAAAALADPTVELLERALGDDAAGALEDAEDLGLIAREGRRVRFTHPLLAHGIYVGVSAPRRREMHRRLSEVVTDPEERARHLAHAGVLPEAIEALDDAARYVRARGAPDVAAELLELAVELGGDPALQVRAAEHHVDADEPRRAQELAERTLEVVEDREARAEALLLLGEISFPGGDYTKAWTLLERALAEAGSVDRLRVAIGVTLSHVLFQLGEWESTAETAEAALAAARRVNEPGRLAQTLAIVALADFCIGRGFDEERLAEALRLEGPNLRTGVAGAPSILAYFLFLWTGRFDEARTALDAVRQRYAERGEEPALAWAASARVLLESWAGNPADARAAGDEAVERGLLDMGTTGRALGLWARSLIGAYAGRADEARRDAEESMALFTRTGSRSFPLWPLTTLGFLELSVGDHSAAASRLAPAAARAVSTGLREPAADGTLFTADAAEALVAVGRIEEAEPIVSLLEERGAALDRAWAIAVGARCRGLILAAQGEVEAAEGALERALVAHERLPMPIERARSLLVLGRIRRRLRKRRAAKAALEEAVAIFDRVESPRWAEQARTEIAAIGLRPGAGDELTPAEARVARLAATGLSNKEVAAALVVSPKTVEAHLGRTYRKLGIRGRTELGARMGQPEER